MIENLREKRASELPTSINSKSMDSNKILIFIEVAIVRKELNRESGKLNYDDRGNQLRELM
jgi:hypothetical protein